MYVCVCVCVCVSVSVSVFVCVCVCSDREKAMGLTPTTMRMASPARLPLGTHCKTLHRGRCDHTAHRHRYEESVAG
jgi:hypothetical protein